MANKNIQILHALICEDITPAKNSGGFDYHNVTSFINTKLPFNIGQYKIAISFFINDNINHSFRIQVYKDSTLVKSSKRLEIPNTAKPFYLWVDYLLNYNVSVYSLLRFEIYLDAQEQPDYQVLLNIAEEFPKGHPTHIRF